MARPPRIPVMLPWECKVIYFITICITPRCNGLANDAAWGTVCETLTQLDEWNTYCIMTMPDQYPLAYCAARPRAERCYFSKMVQALV
jgi:hypothetical protein